MPTRCSVVIPVFNLARVTRRCLDQLLAHPPATIEQELIVVDDASTDETPAMLAEYADRVRVVRHPANAGFATACNSGAGAATGDVLVFLNNDTLPLPGWLDELAACAERHPGSILGAKLLFPDWTVQHAGVVVNQDLHPRHVYAGFPHDHPAVNKERRFPMVTGACLLVDRAWFRETGGFDPGFKNGYEDMDLCMRLTAAGGEVWYCPTAVLFHLESVSDARLKRDLANFDRFFRRWGDRLKPDDVMYFLEDGLLRFTYGVTYPMRCEVSPLLAVVEGVGVRGEVEDLLAKRADQVFQLMRENIALRLGKDPGSLLPAWYKPSA